MDSLQFDALARRASCVSRRSLAALVGGAAAAAAGLGAALDDAAPAGAKRRRVTGEHNVRGNKAIMCVDGETRKVPKKKRKSYLKQGATRGACVSPAACPTGQKSCNGGCIASTACCTNADCASGETCVSGVCVAPLKPCGQGGPCRVFVSSTTYTGSLGGVAGADEKCQQMAVGAGLSGLYMAWIASSTSTPATHFLDTSKGGPYHLVANGTDSGGEGPVVANDFAEFTSCSMITSCLQHAIDRDQTGTTLGKPTEPWTAVLITGLASTNTCGNWVSNSNIAYGLYGDTAAVNSGWTATESDACDSTRPIYCMEQPAVV
ncbi:MAG: hypothetical protein QM692_14105 [Thermomicrobiales bacterium]